LAAIVLGGIALRLANGLPRCGLTDVREYDDGVHYAAGFALAHGLVPYRDFVLLHPPGIALLMAPFALLGEVIGQPYAMAAARVAILAVSALNMLLVARLCGIDSRRAGLVAAFGYAIAPGAIAAEHTVMLEPLINFACLGAAINLRNKRHATAGFMVAISICLKLFPITFAIAAVVVLWGNPLAIRRFALALVAGLICIAGPFFLLAPASMWHQVVVVQATRPPAGVGDITSRLASFAPILLAVGAMLLLRNQPRLVKAELRIWTVTASLTVVAFLASSSFFSHYLAYLAPCFAGLIAAAVMGRSRLAKGLAGVALVVALPSAWHYIRHPVGVPAPRGASEIAARGCVVAENPSLLVALDLLASSPACPLEVDPRGAALAGSQGLPSDFYPNGFRTLAVTQQELARELHRAQAFVSTTKLTSDPMLDAANRAYVDRCFRLVAAESPWNMWTRRDC
jgi:alpha-1,2-mannosyltransferase